MHLTIRMVAKADGFDRRPARRQYIEDMHVKLGTLRSFIQRALAEGPERFEFLPAGIYHDSQLSDRHRKALQQLGYTTHRDSWYHPDHWDPAPDDAPDADYEVYPDGSEGKFFAYTDDARALRWNSRRP